LFYVIFTASSGSSRGRNDEKPHDTTTTHIRKQAGHGLHT
jgi:hypothetical protein